MKTLSNIIPNPLNVNKILNSNYSTSRFATSDYNGKENTEVIKGRAGNIASNRVSESGEEFYLGGIGEIGLVMQNVNFINKKIKKYKGTEIPLDGKYVSSTLYNEQDQSNKNYSSGNAKEVWYYDVSYGMINHGDFTNAYKKLPLYKYDIKDFESTEDDFDEFDDGNLYLTYIKQFTINNDDTVTYTITYHNSFNIMDYFYYCQDDTLDNMTNSLTYTFFEDNNDKFPIIDKSNIEKYPIYQKDDVYSMPLLPSYRLDNYYDCEFLVAIPYIIRKEKQTYDIDLIYKNIKLVIKFGNGDLKEVLDPFAKMNDCVIYKFRKQWLFEHMFINNQEIIISLVDYGTNNKDNQVLVSKKIFFNLFKILFYQGKYNNYDFRFKYNNYYPLKYPLKSKKKFLELDYVPYEDIENFNEDTLTETTINTNYISYKDPYINFNDISNNYAYLNTYIYHNISEGNNLIEWFIKENGNGLFVDPNQNDVDIKYFNFSIENPNKENLECYCKTFINYDEDGILDSNINIVQLTYTDITSVNPNLRKFNNFNVCGLKQIIYLPYKFDINNVYRSNLMKYTNIGGLSIFEDYLYIYNSTDNDVKLYFTDESLTLCENTRIINIPSRQHKIYRPSKHDDYNIIVKNCLLNTYKLSFYQIYKPFIDDSNRITSIMNNIYDYIRDGIDGINNLENMKVDLENNDIVKVPIYDYSIPLFGNIIKIDNK